ncbi:MAG: hypothetical protein A2161_10405 [Candidatus Schekmanbacteria bacterium RBG_13_48_7]|uniref:Uncharacterized protein n=1 Tax=Candidatus Schekmanbacteria bacterium RBG_13_48_7 TaxID=1817878 RepID=A0A1F7RNP0_9BACT|nr:MAG: hypothetical protein A2161_10405 [Candidatus Schekmanbacteria bacterium RBG_13_48_7]
MIFFSLIINGFEATMNNGLIIQSMYHMEGNTPVISIFGRLENSETFLVKITTFKPYFFIRVQDLENATQLASFESESTDLKTLDGHQVVRINFLNPGAVPDIRNHFFKNGIECFEADIRFLSSRMFP